MGTKHCVKERWEAFKCRRKYHDLLCCCGYDEIIVSSFAQQIEYEYYGGNRSVSIDGNSLENFSASTQYNKEVPDKEVSRKSGFHSFFSNDSKKYSATTAAHSKHMLQLL